MSSHAQIADRWIDNAMGWNDRALSPMSNVYYTGDTIFSYGSHFPMGIVLRDLPARDDEPGYYSSAASVRTKGDPRLILLNGDSYSSSTTRHQGAVRDAAQRACLPVLIVPFSALGGARIDVRTIEPIDIRDDRIEETVHHGDSNDPRLGKPIDRYNPETTVYEPASDERVVGRGSNWPRAELVSVLGEPAQWRWTTSRHWLGDSAFFARGIGDRTRRRYLSSFDYQEAHPLYFLCELPRTGEIETVEQAIELLKPPIVKQAIEEGREVTRQGDVFAIPTELSTRDLKQRHTPWGKGRIVKRPRFGLLDTNHTASEVIFATGGRVYARGLLYHLPQDGRTPDHARRKMGDGKTWHLLTRNTVPRQRASTDRTEVAA